MCRNSLIIKFVAAAASAPNLITVLNFSYLTVTYLRDSAGVTGALEVLDSLIVVPDFDDLVLATRDVVFSFSEDGQCVDLSGARAVEHADGLTIEAVPVGDLSV